MHKRTNERTNERTNNDPNEWQSRSPVVEDNPREPELLVSCLVRNDSGGGGGKGPKGKGGKGGKGKGGGGGDDDAAVVGRKGKAYVATSTFDRAYSLMGLRDPTSKRGQKLATKNVKFIVFDEADQIIDANGPTKVSQSVGWLVG